MSVSCFLSSVVNFAIVGGAFLSFKTIQKNNFFLFQGNGAAANQRNLPVILLKLTVVMGITWILAFALAFYPTPYLEYPFNKINSCQGEYAFNCLFFLFLISQHNLFRSVFHFISVQFLIHNNSTSYPGLPYCRSNGREDERPWKRGWQQLTETKQDGFVFRCYS